MPQADALEVLAGLVMPTGATFAECATTWQLDDLLALIDGTKRMHYLTRPRSGSKTTDLGALVAVWLLTMAAPGARGFGCACDRDQAGLLLDGIRGFVMRTPGLAGALVLDQWKISNAINGATFSALAADGPGAFGLRPDLIVIDELGQWGEAIGAKTLWDAMLSSQPKADCLFVVITTASSPAHFSFRVLEQARASDRWRTSEQPGPVPWVAPAALEEQRALLLPSQYARLHLNQWTEAEDSLAAHDDLMAACTLDGPLEPKAGVSYVIGLDVGLTRDRTAAFVCHREGDRVVVDRRALWKGSSSNPVTLADVELWIEQAARDYNRAAVLADPFQFVAGIQRLKRRGVRIRAYTFSATSVGRLAVSLFNAIRDRRIDLPDDPALIDELAHVRVLERSPGQYRLDHPSDKHDDQAVALSLCVDHLTAKRTSTPARFFHAADARIPDAKGPPAWIQRRVPAGYREGGIIP